eukprot:NODE_5867_length_631_cov_5.584192_g5470_i0.p1 GENE.NODE_5867_length_631_cov_5.584192_g5470_i0~~NODE_5867_length_631_cov_5.584192_g5470_i0.p1  ORF type:complete len:154 (-),score=13.20 NODE_5867_length_631_cov_5.584192_g5470_i0:37-498(-)
MISGSKSYHARIPDPVETATAIVQGVANVQFESASIYIGNVDYSVCDNDLRAIFAGCGVIERVTVPMNNQSNSHMGYAYMSFDLAKSPDAIDKAISLDGMMLKGRKLKITLKRVNVPGLRTRLPYTEGHEAKETGPILTPPGTRGRDEWICPA